MYRYFLYGGVGSFMGSICYRFFYADFCDYLSRKNHILIRPVGLINIGTMVGLGIGLMQAHYLK